jgi:hypothetical protein
MNNLDFDDASFHWRKNKVCIGKGYFKYKCSFEGCNNLLYCYTTENKHFLLFASDFDLKNKDNSNKFYYCENHL